MALLTGLKSVLKGAPKPPVRAPVVPVVGKVGKDTAEVVTSPPVIPHAGVGTPQEPPIGNAAPQATVPPVTPPTPPTPPTPTPPATEGSAELWLANPSMKDSIKKHLSAHDMLKSIAGEEFANQMYRNAPKNINTGAGPSTVLAKNAGDEELRLLYDTLDKHTGMTSLWTTLLPWKRKAAMETRRDIGNQASRHLIDSYNKEVAGLPITPHPDARIEEVVEMYRKSKFAENSLDRQTGSGMDTSNIRKSANYFPVHHDHHKIVKFTKNIQSKMDDLAEAYGDQILKAYPNSAKIQGITRLKLGRGFMQTQKDSAIQSSASPFRGTTLTEVAGILKSAGVGDAEIKQVMNQVTPAMEGAGKNKHHKSRMNMDLEQQYFGKDGTPFKLGDFIKTNMEGQLDAYNNTMAHRIGLAKAGYPDEATLKTKMDDIASKYIGDEKKYKEVRGYLDTMFDEFMGRPTGAAMSDLMRSLATVAQSLFLKRSGLFNVVDLNHSIERFGLAKVAVKFLPAFKGVLKSQPMTPGIARRLDDVISGRLIGEGRMRSVINMHEDNFAGAVTLTHDWIRAAGQTTKFLNMSEYLRRQHINLVTGIQADYLESIAKATGSFKGEAAKARKYFNDIGIDDAMIDKLKVELNQHGLYTDNWTDQLLSDELATILSTSVDDFAIQVRRGELPTWLAHSQVGKVIFPFFTFSAGTNQKVLRQTYNAGGVSALAIMAAHQAPLAVIVAAAANVMDGKEWDEDVLKRAVGIAPGIGYGAFGYTAFERGEVGSTPTMWAAFNSGIELTKGVADGDINKIVKNIPGISASPVLQTLNAALKD